MSRRRDLCPDWPHCRCARKFNNTDWLPFDPQDALTADEFDAMMFEVVFLLSCLSRHCPDHKLRENAQVQLLHPVFRDELRRGRWLN
ncbi:hypothetical protein [Bradyrhizobium ganzhouense]|uniref:hypothetical protein n=1 Tax=Bradyrhizobium ganzhouense TaxID=1179767 RepID=UPI003CF351FB